uniref:Uncharacterized protein n=1 Tax=Arundo donax TaxID=35708 RepID=A0A0A9EVG8_ARUDO
MHVGCFLRLMPLVYVRIEGCNSHFVSSFPEVSDQNFSEEDVGANDEPCKKRRPTSPSSVPNDQST